MFVSPCIPILTIGIELLFTTVSGVTAQSVTVSMILLFIINIVVFFLYESLSIAYARAAKATVQSKKKLLPEPVSADAECSGRHQKISP